MREKKQIVINTGPILALIAGLGDLAILKELYEKVFVPYEVCIEITTGSPHEFGKREFQQAKWLKKIEEPLSLSSYLAGVLDRGEAAVIQYALDNNIETVCIDEIAGRRVARLSGLKLTGFIGIFLRAKELGIQVSVSKAIERMKHRGIYISEKVMKFAIKKAGE
jgi:predicted nucleic acid-binding protein